MSTDSKKFVFKEDLFKYQLPIHSTTIRRFNAYVLCFLLILPALFAYDAFSTTTQQEPPPDTDEGGDAGIEGSTPEAEEAQEAERSTPGAPSEAGPAPDLGPPPENTIGRSTPGAPSEAGPAPDLGPPPDTDEGGDAGIEGSTPEAEEAQEAERSTPGAPSEAGPASNVQQPEQDSSPSNCLIATAAFGSELSPQVQFLRNFRDNHILLTISGSSFMDVFNAWYYSFSPYVANYEKANPWFQQTVKILIYPLLWILQLSEKTYSYLDGEYGSLAAGLVASSLIGSVYFTPFVIMSRRIRKTDLDKKLIVVIEMSVILAVFVSMLYRNEVVLMVTTSILVLTTIGVSSIFAARAIIYVGKLILRPKRHFLSVH